LNIYLVVGVGMNDSLVSALEKNGFNVIGSQYTMDAAVITLKKKPLHPDLFIINGLAQASGTNDGVINRLQSMLIKLRDIRLLAPKSRILLILPSRNTPEVIKRIVSLGIYDIRQTSQFDRATLLNWIENPMSIADFTDFSTGEVPDTEQGEIRYGLEEQGNKPGLKKKESINIGRDILSKITLSLGGEEFINGSKKAAGISLGKPGALLAVGDARIEEWIRGNFSDHMDVLASLAEPEEVRQKISQLSPDIFIIMRQSAIGGIPGADELAAWAAGHVPAVLFIVGQMDDEGRAMVHRARGAGIRHIITCEVGGQIYGDELVYVLTTIIKEMQENGSRLSPGQVSGPSFEAEAGKAVNALLQGAGMLGRAIKQTAGKVSEKNREKAVKSRGRPRINRSGGIPLEEESNTFTRDLKNPTAIVPGGILAVVTPWRPGLAGRLSAQAVKILGQVDGGEVAYIGASGQSTGALWLDLPDDVLMMSDWRVPGSSYPIVQDNLRIYVVDPVKDLSPAIENELWDLLKKARRTAAYTVIDFAGDISSAQKAAHQGRSVLLVIVPGNDPVELKIASHWVKNIMDGKQNVVTGIDMRGVAASIPEGLKPKVIIRNSPADALITALMKNKDDEFIWN